MNRRRFLKLIGALAAGGFGVRLFSDRAETEPILGQASVETTATAENPPGEVAASLPPSTTLPVASVVVIPKGGWGGAAVVGTFVEHTIERITVHHTASPLDDNRNAPSRVRAHQRFHQQDRQWPDIAYHFIVDRNGHIYEGRPTWAAGDTGTDYDPTGHFLVCAEGEFGSQSPTTAQLESIASLLSWGSAAFGVSLDTVLGHRDVASTSCPGDVLYDQFGNLVAQAELMGSAEMVLLSDDEARQLVASIEAGSA